MECTTCCKSSLGVFSPELPCCFTCLGMGEGTMTKSLHCRNPSLTGGVMLFRASCTGTRHHSTSDHESAFKSWCDICAIKRKQLRLTMLQNYRIRMLHNDNNLLLRGTGGRYAAYHPSINIYIYIYRPYDI